MLDLKFHPWPSYSFYVILREFYSCLHTVILAWLDCNYIANICLTLVFTVSFITHERFVKVNPDLERCLCFVRDENNMFINI